MTQVFDPARRLRQIQQQILRLALTDEKGRARLQLCLSQKAAHHGMLGLVSESGHPTLLAYGDDKEAGIAGRDADGKIVWIVPDHTHEMTESKPA